MRHLVILTLCALGVAAAGPATATAEALAGPWRHAGHRFTDLLAATPRRREIEFGPFRLPALGESPPPREAPLLPPGCLASESLPGFAFESDRSRPGAGIRLRRTSPLPGWNRGVDPHRSDGFRRPPDAPAGTADLLPDPEPTANDHLGADLWLAVSGKPGTGPRLWGETWGELDRQYGNATRQETEDFDILMLQPKVGLAWDTGGLALQPYLTAEMSPDTGDAFWNKAPWRNNLQYGPGIRLSFKDLGDREGSNLYLYTEALGIDYFTRMDEFALARRADSDLRVGLEFRLPFGGVSHGSKRRR